MFQPRIIAILQARMGATRLPGKPLKKILEKPLLQYQLERLARAKTLTQIVVATTSSSLDQQIVNLCNSLHVPVFQGDENNVLDRYYNAAKHFKADIIVRVTGDCPILDPAIVDQVVNYYLSHSDDYVSNTLKLTFPRGQDVEVFSFKLLEKAWDHAKTEDEQEHVTPYFYLHPKIFKLGNVAYSTDESHHRWTVDTQEDLQLIAHIIEELYPVKPEFTMEEVLELLKKHPEWVEINAHIKQKVLDKKRK